MFKNFMEKDAVQIGQMDYNNSCSMAFTMLQNARLPPIVQSKTVIQLSGRTQYSGSNMKLYVMEKSEND